MLIPRGKLIQDNLANSYLLLEPLVDDLREGGFSGLVEIVLQQTNAFIVFDAGNVAAFLEKRGDDCARVTLDELAAKSRDEPGRVLIYAYPPLTASLIAARVNAHSLYDAVSAAVTDPARLLDKLARELDREWFVEVHCSNGTSSLVCVGEGLCCVIDSTVESDAEPFDSTNLGESQKLNELLAECQSFGATLSVSFLRADEAARPLYVEVTSHIVAIPDDSPDDSPFETSNLAQVDIPILDEASLPPQISEDLFSQEGEESESYLDLQSAKSPERDAQNAVSELSGSLDPADVEDFDFDQIQPSGSSDWIDESTLETVEDQSGFEGYQIDATDWGAMPELVEQPEGENVHHQTGEAAEAVIAAEVQSQEAPTREVESPAESPEAASPEDSIPAAASLDSPTLEAPTREVESPAESPEAASPEDLIPAATSLDSPTLEAPTPGTTTLEAPTPEAPTLEAATFEAADPEASIPETASPEAASTEAASPEFPIPETASPEPASTEAASPEFPIPETVSTETASPEVPSLGVPTQEAVSAASLETNFESHDSVHALIAESAELTFEPKLESESDDNTPASIPTVLIEPNDTNEEHFGETNIRDEIVRLDDYPEPVVEPPDSDAGVEIGSQAIEPGVEIASPAAVVTTDDRIEAESQLTGEEEPAISGEVGEIAFSETDENISIVDAGANVDQSEPVIPREPLASLADDIRQLTAAEMTAPDIPLDAEIADDLSDVKRLMAEICRTIDEAAQGVGKPDNFSMSLRAGQIKVADDYPFLDPFAGEFEYLAGEIVFVGQATADEFIEGLSQALMFAIERVIETTSYPERFRAYLAEDLRKIAARNESEFARFSLDGVINRLLDGETASATGS